MGDSVTRDAIRTVMGIFVIELMGLVSPVVMMGIRDLRVCKVGLVDARRTTTLYSVHKLLNTFSLIIIFFVMQSEQFVLVDIFFISAIHKYVCLHRWSTSLFVCLFVCLLVLRFNIPVSIFSVTTL